MNSFRSRPPASHFSRGFTAWLALLLCILFAATAQALPPELKSDTGTATAGFFRLSWETDAARVELQEAEDAGFQHPQTRYIGPDRATVISGKPDGDLYYRIRTRDEPAAGAWSETVHVTVAHHSLNRALMFFGLGVAVFLATLAVIVRGTGRVR